MTNEPLLLPLVVLCFWIGLYPRPLFQVLEKPVDYLVAKVDPGYAAAAKTAAGGSPSASGAAAAMLPKMLSTLPAVAAPAVGGAK